MRLAAGLALLVCLPSPAQAAFLVSGFATNLPGTEQDDAWEVWNTGPDPIGLDGVEVGDGEGRVAFPVGASLAPGERVRVALQEGAYVEAARGPPAYALDAAEPARRLRALEAGLLLSQEGDELLLSGSGGIVDAVAWGDSTYRGAAWSGPPVDVAGATFLRWYERADADDSDDRSDWERPQRPRLGWREPAIPEAFVESESVAYTAPERSREQVAALVAQAERSLRINAYDLRDVGLVRLIRDRMAGRPELAVTVLVDEQPVGLEADERRVRNALLHELEAAGALVRLLRHDRYAYDHAKYLVADEREILVQSENLVPSGIPADGERGNRGWGLRLDDPDLARALAATFDEDARLDPFGARPLGPGENDTVPPPVFSSPAAPPRRGVARAAGFPAAVIVGPENHLARDDRLRADLRAAREEVLVEQLRVPGTWRDERGRSWPNEYLDALLDGAGRGVRVRILLDGHFQDERGEPENAELAHHLASVGAPDAVAVRLATGAAMPVLHVKGVVVDRRIVHVGSMNWNLNSVAQNREVGLRVEAPGFAEHFRAAFEDDWAQAAPIPSGPAPGLPGPAVAATVILAGALARLVDRRRSPR